MHEQTPHELPVAPELSVSALLNKYSTFQPEEVRGGSGGVGQGGRVGEEGGAPRPPPPRTTHELSSLGTERGSCDLVTPLLRSQFAQVSVCIVGWWVWVMQQFRSLFAQVCVCTVGV